MTCNIVTETGPDSKLPRKSQQAGHECLAITLFQVDDAKLVQTLVENII